MSFSPDEGCYISLNDAEDLTKEYRQNNPNSTNGHFYGKNKMLEILNQSGVVGFRAYYGLDQGTKKLVFVGVDSRGDDLTSGVILDCGVACPPACGRSNPLNS